MNKVGLSSTSRNTSRTNPAMIKSQEAARKEQSAKAPSKFQRKRFSKAIFEHSSPDRGSPPKSQFKHEKFAQTLFDKFSSEKLHNNRESLRKSLDDIFSKKKLLSSIQLNSPMKKGIDIDNVLMESELLASRIDELDQFLNQSSGEKDTQRDTRAVGNFVDLYVEKKKLKFSIHLAKIKKFKKDLSSRVDMLNAVIKCPIEEELEMEEEEEEQEEQEGLISNRIISCFENGILILKSELVFLKFLASKKAKRGKKLQSTVGDDKFEGVKDMLGKSGKLRNAETTQNCGTTKYVYLDSMDISGDNINNLESAVLMTSTKDEFEQLSKLFLNQSSQVQRDFSNH